MRNRLLAISLTVVGALLGAVPLFAHHGYANYDTEKKVTLKGTVTKWIWSNPHCLLMLDVTDDSGKITNFAFEMGPPNGLQRSGWTRNTMHVGDVVIVEGTLAKDGSNQANARSVTLAGTGKKLGAASSENNTP